jgi:2,4-dienoyl-CoA reductase-like NADH-dependent reductase (Old Yellow Enzyme family)
MVHYRCEPGNTCGTFHLVHLGRYALVGFGLVFVEATAVDEIGLINAHDLGIWNDAQVESFKPLIAFMRRENTAIGIQFAHGGRKSSSQNGDAGHGTADGREPEGRRQEVATWGTHGDRSRKTHQRASYEPAFSTRNRF